jgi:ABC-type nitrate/sulfonate/bicarbonate transport system substrate-binding protein
MADVKVVLVKGTEKLYPNAKASLGGDRTLFVKRNDETIAQFLAEHYQYWEYADTPVETKVRKKS